MVSYLRVVSPRGSQETIRYIYINKDDPQGEFRTPYKVEMSKIKIYFIFNTDR